VFLGADLRGILLYEFKEKSRKEGRLEENAHFNQGVSVVADGIIPLNDYEMIVFDCDKNVWLFERYKQPICDSQKYNLMVQGGIKIGETVTKGIMG
jgi:hypothetical protein